MRVEHFGLFRAISVVVVVLDHVQPNVIAQLVRGHLRIVDCGQHVRRLLLVQLALRSRKARPLLVMVDQ